MHLNPCLALKHNPIFFFLLSFLDPDRDIDHQQRQLFPELSHWSRTPRWRTRWNQEARPLWRQNQRTDLWINFIVQEHCREKWRNQIENMQAGSKKLWPTIKSLSNPRKQDLPTISFGSYTPLDPKKCSAALNRQFHQITKRSLKLAARRYPVW